MTARALLVTALVAGCAGPAVDSRLAPAYDATGKLTRLAYDSDSDGRPDMVASMDGAGVRVVEVDENADGLFDRREFYGSAQALTRVERVARQGTTIVRRESYEDGVLVSVQEDRDADGRADRWEAYSGGGLTTLELDTVGAGQPTRRLRYDGDRVVVEALD